MESTTIAILASIGLLLLLFLGMPVACALGFVAVVGLWLLRGVEGLIVVGNITFGTLDNFILLAVPLFILMGEAIFISGLGADLYATATKWLGRLPGGLGVATVGACAVFGAMCGVTAAGAATVGVIAIPEMLKRDYSPRLATGSVAAAGALASLIPPSVVMILYGFMADVSVGKLFIAGIIPGIMLAGIMASYIILLAIRRPAVAPPSVVRVHWKERLFSLGRVWPVLVLIFLVLGTIYTGICTPTEAAGAGAMGAILVAVLLYRAVRWGTLRDILTATVRTSGMILIIIVSAMILGCLFTQLGIPQLIIAFVGSLEVSRYLVMIGINVVLIVFGMFVDPATIILLTCPLLVPLVSALGFDLLWFGIIMVINMEIAVITPPVGLNLYIIKGITKDVELGDIILGALPFFGCQALAIGILIAFPSIALWLPGMMM